MAFSSYFDYNSYSSIISSAYNSAPQGNTQQANANYMAAWGVSSDNIQTLNNLQNSVSPIAGSVNWANGLQDQYTARVSSGGASSGTSNPSNPLSNISSWAKGLEAQYNARIAAGGTANGQPSNTISASDAGTLMAMMMSVLSGSSGTTTSTSTSSDSLKQMMTSVFTNIFQKLVQNTDLARLI